MVLIRFVWQHRKDVRHVDRSLVVAGAQVEQVHIPQEAVFLGLGNESVSQRSDRLKKHEEADAVLMGTVESITQGIGGRDCVDQRSSNSHTSCFVAENKVSSDEMNRVPRRAGLHLSGRKLGADEIA